RGFLEDALIAATYAATAGVGAAGVRRAWGETPGSTPNVGPNDQIRVAVIGLRGRGRDHVRGYSTLPDVTIAALCDCDTSVVAPALAAATRAGKPEPKVYQDLRKLLENPEIDAVSIATPNHWHTLAAVRA